MESSRLKPPLCPNFLKSKLELLDCQKELDSFRQSYSTYNEQTYLKDIIQINQKINQLLEQITEIQLNCSSYHQNGCQCSLE